LITLRSDFSSYSGRRIFTPHQGTQVSTYTHKIAAADNPGGFIITQIESNKENAVDPRKRDLASRRKNLLNVLTSESESLENEIKSLRKNKAVNLENFSHMKERLDNIRSARAEENKRLAQEKLYENWRMNNPLLREIESKKFQSYVKNVWDDQVKQNSSVAEEEKLREMEYASYLKSQDELHQLQERAGREQRLERELELKEVLKQQIVDLKQKEALTKMLNAEESELVNFKNKFLNLQSQRLALSEKVFRINYGQQLLRQHKAKLYQKSKEIQDALDFDLKMLESINESEDKDREEKRVAKEASRVETEQLIAMLREQKRLEKEREAELNVMFQDEAQKIWNKRNEEWLSENNAREALMKEVMQGLHEQIDTKINALKDKKVESLRERERLIRSIEQAKTMANEQSEMLKRAKEETKLSLEKQINERKNEFLNGNVIENLTLAENDKNYSHEFDNLVEVEKNKAAVEPFKAKVNKNLCLPLTVYSQLSTHGLNKVRDLARV
jgi:trichoplein keratin filament-binding protein